MLVDKLIYTDSGGGGSSVESRGADFARPALVFSVVDAAEVLRLALTGGGVCAICLCGFVLDEEVVELPCAHAFHSACALSPYAHHPLPPARARPAGGGTGIVPSCPLCLHRNAAVAAFHALVGGVAEMDASKLGENFRSSAGTGGKQKLSLTAAQASASAPTPAVQMGQPRRVRIRAMAPLSDSCKRFFL